MCCIIFVNKHLIYWTEAVVGGDILSKFDLLKMGKFKCRTLGKSFGFTYSNSTVVLDFV